ncbi:phospholipid or glycerol acyltransferase, putative [Babesia caballi]|uniref:Phospholipid or glycerol acyltransferase, putative n=1 Tax=Babesia caballi TaxID=5871 RepID=A0AAV4LYH4_BABCB|nr:phospholipid or glycerol acyltransferase, putative [Babesia caballi]
MPVGEGAAEDAARQRKGKHEYDGTRNEGESAYPFDFEAIRVKTKTSFLKRWNSLFIGLLWSFAHYYMTYALLRGLLEAAHPLAFLKKRLFLLGAVAVYWCFLVSSVYFTCLYSKCVQYHVANFDNFSKQYEDHPLQAALMHGDLKNYCFPIHIFGALFLAPMRLVVGICFFALAVILMGIPLVLLGGRLKHHTRRYVAFVFRHLNSMAFWGIGISEVKTVYTHDVPRDRAINVISNHIGVLDVLYMLQSGSFTFICKDALKRAFIIGDFIRLLNYITVNRHCPGNRKDAYLAIVDRMRSIDKGDQTVSMVVYPEGTTSRGNILLPFRHGAFGALVPLQPLLVVLDYSYVNISFDAYTWPWWMFQTFSSPFTTRIIAYWLPVIHPPSSEEVALKGERAAVEEYAARAHQAMREALIKLNPNVDLEYLQQRPVVPSVAWRSKMLSRLYGPVMQRHYKLSDEELRRTEEVIYQ